MLIRKHWILQGPLGFRFLFSVCQEIRNSGWVRSRKSPMLWSSASAFHNKALQLIICGKTPLWTLGSSCGIWLLEATFVSWWPVLTPVPVNLTSELQPVGKPFCKQNENSLRLAKIADRGYLAMWKINLTGVYFNTSLKAQFCRLLNIARLPSIPFETSGPNPRLHKSGKLLLS